MTMNVNRFLTQVFKLMLATFHGEIYADLMS